MCVCLCVIAKKLVGRGGGEEVEEDAKEAEGENEEQEDRPGLLMITNRL